MKPPSTSANLPHSQIVPNAPSINQLPRSRAEVPQDSPFPQANVTVPTAQKTPQ